MLVINLSVFLYVAGVALMEISEVHRKVHLELEENVSARERGESSLVTALPRPFMHLNDKDTLNLLLKL